MTDRRHDECHARAPEAWADDRVFTVEDLEDMPDDGFRYEVEPAGQPSLTVFELRRGRYAQAAQVAGRVSLDIARPFPVTIVPDDLVTTGSR